MKNKFEHNSILFIARMHNPPKTGGEAYHLAVIKALHAKGYDVIHTQPDNLTPWKVRGLRFNIYLSLMALRKKYGIIIINSDFSCRLLPFLAFSSFIMQIKIVSLVYHFYEVDKKFYGLIRYLFLWGEKCGLKLSDKLITISAFTSGILQCKGIAKNKIQIIAPASGVPKQPWKVKDKDGQPITLLYVGYCTKRKGLEYLLDAMRKIRNIDITLDIVGDINIEPNYVESLSNLIKTYQMQSKVFFHGLVSSERLWKYYESADIFVLPSILEGFGISLLEAARFGLPIVSTKSGAIPELIRNRENGLLVPPEDPEALANAILELITNRELRGRIARKAWEESREDYSWETVGESFMKALELN